MTKNQFKITGLMTTLLMIQSIASVYFYSLNKLGIYFTIITIFIFVIAAYFDMTIALIVSLLIYFIYGIFYFWYMLQNKYSTFIDFDSLVIIIWSLNIFLNAVIGGRIHKYLDGYTKQINVYQQQLSQLVAVDPDTGFDNNARMYFELENEHHRCMRYGGTYTFLLFKIKYLDQFKKLYGKNEFEQLLQFISTQVRQTVRKSDSKFRPNTEEIALLLKETSDKQVHIVIDKLLETISNYQLRNGKWITLSIEFGYESFQNEKTYQEIIQSAKEQVAPYA